MDNRKDIMRQIAQALSARPPINQQFGFDGAAAPSGLVPTQQEQRRYGPPPAETTFRPKGTNPLRGQWGFEVKLRW